MAGEHNWSVPRLCDGCGEVMLKLDQIDGRGGGPNRHYHIHCFPKTPQPPLTLTPITEEDCF